MTMQQATTTYTLMNSKSATTDAIRSNPVDLTQQSALIDRGEVAVVTATERKATMATRG
jgi:hypothetical protein